jgi:hypothetical protein
MEDTEMTDPTPIAQALPDLETMTDATASPRLVIASSMPTMAELIEMPTPLSKTDLAVVSAAAMHCPDLAPCGDVYFAKCVRIISTLPHRASDDTSGELMLAVYRRMLGHYSAGAIGYLTEAVLTRCKWMPTIAECIDIITGWDRNDEPYRVHLRAGWMLNNHRQEIYDRLMDDISSRRLSQDQIDALPDAIKRRSFTYGHLHCVNGRWEYRTYAPAFQIEDDDGSISA